MCHTRKKLAPELRCGWKGQSVFWKAVFGLWLRGRLRYSSQTSSGSATHRHVWVAARVFNRFMP